MGTQSLVHTYLYLILAVLAVIVTQFLLTGACIVVLRCSVVLS